MTNDFQIQIPKVGFSPNVELTRPGRPTRPTRPDPDTQSISSDTQLISPDTQLISPDTQLISPEIQLTHDPYYKDPFQKLNWRKT